MNYFSESDGYADFAIEPSGNYNTYTSQKAEYKENLKKLKSSAEMAK